MRHATPIDQWTIVTVDNAACIGEKEADIVKAPNEVVAYFTARVALLEQWCAGAEPNHLVIANFTGDSAWEDYRKGCQRVFDEIGTTLPPITGSTESNFSALQSGISITMIGKKHRAPRISNCHFYVVGQPFVGQEVLAQAEKVANLQQLNALWQAGIIQALWPCGSGGIGREIAAFTGEQLGCELNMTASAGPSTAVLVAVQPAHEQALRAGISAPLYRLQ